MNRSFFTAAIVVALASVALRAAPVPEGAKPVPEVHPLKDAKVGDFATYNMTLRIKDQFIYGSMSQTNEQDLTIWRAKTVPGFYVKVEVDCLDGMVATYELTESGRKK